jgi:hypothetical protein
MKTSATIWIKPWRERSNSAICLLAANGLAPLVGKLFRLRQLFRKFCLANLR